MRTEADAAIALLGDQVENKSMLLKISAIVGLGFAYVGSHREELLALLLPIVADDNLTMELASMAALSLGFVFVGSENGEVTGTILQALMDRFERNDKSLDEKWARFLALGLGLLYLGTALNFWRVRWLTSSYRPTRCIGRNNRDVESYPSSHCQNSSNYRRSLCVRGIRKCFESSSDATLL